MNQKEIETDEPDVITEPDVTPDTTETDPNQDPYKINQPLVQPDPKA